MLPFLSPYMARSLITGLKICQERASEFKTRLLLLHGKKDAVTNHADSSKFFSNASRY